MPRRSHFMWLTVALWSAFPLTFLVAGIAYERPGFLGLALLFAVIFSPGLGLLLSMVRRNAWWVTVDEEGIEGRPLFGERTALRWQEVAEVRDLSVRRPNRPPAEELLLVGADGRRTIKIMDALPHFAELAAEIDRRTPHARRTRDDRPRWRRELVPRSR